VRVRRADPQKPNGRLCVAVSEPQPAFPGSEESATPLHTWERWVLSLIGVVLLFAAIWLWVSPPDHTAPAPDAAKCTNAKDCVVQIDEVPEVLLATFTAIGAVFLLIGVNGRRVIRFAAAGASFDTAAAADQGRKAEKVVESKVAAPARAPSGATQVRLEPIAVGRDPDSGSEVRPRC
jgi:hypothetical protein